MTWSVRIVKDDSPLAETREDACRTCKHGSARIGQHVPCIIKNAADTLGYMLTAIDVGRNGHMASGTAKLICYGYEEQEPPAEVKAATAG